MAQLNPSLMKRLRLYVLLFSLGATKALSSETLPPAPRSYFNDYANVVSPQVATNLNQQLEQFERQTSDQVVVAVFPKMQSDSSLEDYTHRLMESWKVGQRTKNNGVGLFVFIADRRARIEVNYGLEGALPDAVSKRIIEEEILPAFRNKDYAGGLTAGVAAIQKAIRGEYTGNGKTAADANGNGNGWTALAYLLPLILLIGFGLLGRRYSRGGTAYDHNGRGMFASALLLGLFSGGMGGGRMGGGGMGGGGGGFAGGGGMGGGGGASGSW